MSTNEIDESRTSERLTCIEEKLGENQRRIDDGLSSLQEREARYVTIANGVVAFLAAIFLGFNVYNSSQVSDAIHRAGDRVDALEQRAQNFFGGALVENSRVSSTKPESDSIIMVPYITYLHDSFVNRDRIVFGFWAYYKVHVEGGHGEMVAAEFLFEGAMKEVLPGFQPGVATETVLAGLFEDWIIRDLEPDIMGSRGFSIVPADGARSFSARFRGYFDSCAEVEGILSELLGDAGKVSIRPVLLNIDESPEASRFDIEIEFEAFNGCNDPVHAPKETEPLDRRP